MKTTKAAKLAASVILLIALVVSGCSKNDSLTGPNANNQVSFTLSQQNGVNGGVDFLFKPSVNVKISRIISKYEAQTFADTINTANSNYVYSKDSTYIINEYVGVQTGQQWKFEFSGSLSGQLNSNYNVTTNYTVQ